MDLFKKFMEVIKEELSQYGVGDYAALDDQEIIALNLNLKAKMIRPLRYEVKESTEVKKLIKNLRPEHQAAYDEIKKKLVGADDVNQFLSKQAVKPRFQDFLLLDWNIHHFHLNKNNSGGYFNDRSDYLLMVLFKDTIAHFISIEHHSDDEVFVKREYLEIIQEHWPEALESYELKGVLDVSFDPSNEDIKKLRKNQINTCLKIGGKVYAPIGGGITTAGTGLIHIRRAMKWKKHIEEVEKKYKANKDMVLEDIYKKTGKRYKDLDLDFDYHNNHLVLFDKNSNLIIEPMLGT